MIDHRVRISLKFCGESGKPAVFANVLCELTTDTVSFILGKSRIFYGQRGFKKLKCYNEFIFCDLWKVNINIL